MSAPASCRPGRRGRPSKETTAVWELDIRALEMREMFATIGPSLRAMERCHPKEVSFIASRIARQVTRDYHRRQ